MIAHLAVDRIPKVMVGDPNETGPYQDGHSHPVVQLEHNIVNGQIVSFQDYLS